MYEEETNQINWMDIFRRILIFLAILLVVFGILSLVNKCSNRKVNETKTEEKVISLKNKLDELEQAGIKYFTKENLPTEINSPKTIKLKYLINRELITAIKDDAGNVCDTTASYVEVTKLENNYAVKTYLQCGNNTDYKISYAGCFNTCKDGEFCLGDAQSTNGICTTGEIPVVKPQNGNQNSNQSNNQNTSTPQKKVMYEYKKCTDNYSCTPNSNNLCTTSTVETLTGKVIAATSKTNYSCTDGYSYVNGTCTKTLNPTTTSNTTCSDSTYKYQNGTCQKAVNATASTEQKCFKSTTELAKAGYTFVKYDTSCGYVGKKDTYKCTQGTPSGTKCIITNSSLIKTTTNSSCSLGTLTNGKCVIEDKSKVKTDVSTTPAHCQDNTYTYNASTNTCTKKTTVTTTTKPVVTQKCETKWSYETSLAGWTRTGNTK